MRLSKPLLQLPIRFSADKLAAEVRALPRSAWMPHPTGFAGNEAVPLVSPQGEMTDAFEGPMRPTEHLEQCPYIMSLMAELNCVWGRSRLMALAAGAEVPEHIDIHYYWRTHVRIHIPVITNPGVLFTCNGETVHMEAGECWAFDSFALHNVQNQGSERRVHLVLDTVGGERLWDLLEAASAGTPPDPGTGNDASSEATSDPLTFEQINRPKVMSPWEIERHLIYILDHAPVDARSGPVAKRLDRFISAWRAAWARFGESDEGLPTYRALIEDMRGELKSLNAGNIRLSNNQGLDFTIDALVLWNAVSPVPTRH
ncbi:MAG: aspartyl/asparaginyl beta-hydroxylase domain-containing protein [Sphingomonas sp.]|uniref:aspartyl/asparaginyl beta-hydroxylase domain-containing protein n=1 Tax=Sphingomonas sp. TaxID=28214 RepID=UPI0017EB9E65|nr:aspartyl/asparaginyl beta-hydroxylase domain-containing protein [Sphingomonas sp.]MBA3667171.1 aspartyl/asparaginyl beta-hydroxylase domain-containing protein [Sphingomonas sp.]